MCNETVIREGIKNDLRAPRGEKQTGARARAGKKSSFLSDADMKILLKGYIYIYIGYTNCIFNSGSTAADSHCHRETRGPVPEIIYWRFPAGDGPTLKRRRLPTAEPSTFVDLPRAYSRAGAHLENMRSGATCFYKWKKKQYMQIYYRHHSKIYFLG